VGQDCSVVLLGSGRSYNSADEVTDLHVPKQTEFFRSTPIRWQLNEMNPRSRTGPPVSCAQPCGGVL